MYLLKSKALLLSVCLSFVYAQEDILSPVHENIFKLKKEKTKEESSKLKKDWINPIIYKYSKSYSDTLDTTKSHISISQPLFKSGGIFSAIKYAGFLQEYSDLDIDIQRKNLIKDATKILFNLYKLDLQIKKQQHAILNSLLDITRKKEQVLGGFLDTSFLDNAIIKSNSEKSLLIDLEYQKEELINNFSNISHKKYHELKPPRLSLLSKKAFIQKNILIEQSHFDIKTKNNFRKTIEAKYLPSLNFVYDYTKYHASNNEQLKDGSTYGFNISMPFDIRFKNDIQAQKIATLIAKENLSIVELKEKNLYKNKLAKIKMLQNKAKLANEDYELYASLLEIIIEEKDAQIKTQSDVDTLVNSQAIKALDIKIFYYEEQIELLDLYSKIK